MERQSMELDSASTLCLNIFYKLYGKINFLLSSIYVLFCLKV